MNPQLDQDESQEDFTRLEKTKYIELLTFISLLQMILSGFLIFYAINLQTQYESVANQILLALAVIQTIISIFSIFWSLKEPRIIKQSTDKWYDTSQHPLSKAIFLITTTITALLIACVVLGSQNVDDATSFYTAINGKKEIEVFRTNYMNFFYKSILCAGGIILLNFYTIFVSYIYCNSPNSFRLVMYFISLIVSIALTFQMYLSKNLSSYSILIGTPNKADFTLSNVVYIICIAYHIILIFGNLVNYQNHRIGYLVISCILVIITSILVSLNGVVFRNAIAIKEQLGYQCKNAIVPLHMDDLKSIGCQNKYLETNQQFLSCSSGQQSIMWEDNIIQKQKGLPIVEKMACLNMNCCGALGMIYIHPFKILASNGLCIVLIGMFLIGCSQFLSNKYSGNKQKNTGLELCFFVLSLLLFVMAIFISTYAVNPPTIRQNTIIEAGRAPEVLETHKDFSIKHFHQLHTQQTKSNILQVAHNQIQRGQTKYIVNSNCIQIINIFPKELNLELDQNICLTKFCQSDGLRIAILISGCYFKYDLSYNEQFFKVFDNRIIDLVFPGESDLTKNFIAFEGTSEQVNNFFKNMLFICIEDPISIQIKVIQGQVNLNRTQFMPTNTPQATELIVKIKSQKQNVIDHKKHQPSQQPKQKLTEKSTKLLRRFLSQGISKNRINTNLFNQQQIKTHLQLQVDAPALDTQKEFWIDKYVHFSSILVDFVDVTTNSPIDQDIEIQIFDNIIECQSHFNLIPKQILYSQGASYQINNYELGSYTLIFSAEGYSSYCLEANLNQKDQVFEFIVPLSKLLQQNSIRITLEWNSNDVILDLFGVYQTDQTSNCMSSYINKNCQGMTIEQENVNTKSRKFQSIRIDQFLSYYYLFFVKEYINQKTHEIQQKLEESGVAKRNTPFLLSDAIVRIYKEDNKYPISAIKLPRIQNDQVLIENNLAWLLYCFDGDQQQQTDQLQDQQKFNQLNEMWFINQDKSSNQHIKQPSEEFPSPNYICGMHKTNKKQQ